MDVSSLEYWQVDRIVGSGNANIALYWEDATGSGINNCADLTIARYNGTSWDERPGTTTGGSTCSGAGTGLVVSNSAITAFSPFTFGSKSTTLNPLPVQVTEFTSECNNEGLTLSWSTASENNNNYFIIEKSRDAVNWIDLELVKGAGNSSTVKEYSLADQKVSSEILYYRLSQVDYDGKTEVYKIIFSDCNSSQENWLVYPNPSSGQVSMEFTLSKEYGKGTVKIVNHLGQVCQEQTYDLKRGKNTYPLFLNLSSGLYTVVFSSGTLVLPARQLIVK